MRVIEWASECLGLGVVLNNFSLSDDIEVAREHVRVIRSIVAGRISTSAASLWRLNEDK